MKKMNFDDTELEYAIQGSGESVIIIHGGLYNQAFLLQRETILTKHYRLICYSRRGYSGSTHPKRSITIAEHASDCKNLMDRLEVHRAHIVGDSNGAQIALQFAVDYPRMVHTLSILEPLLTNHPSGQKMAQAVTPIFETHQRGDKEGATNAMLTGMGGPDAIKLIEKATPGGMKQVRADADGIFKFEFPAVLTWSFTVEEARRVRQPVLIVRASESGPLFKEMAEALSVWLPKSETFVVPQATHFMTLTNGRGVAEALGGFFARHPMKISSTLK